MIMTSLTTLRPATEQDSMAIARLIQIASDGVTDYLWSTLTNDYPGCTLLEIGAQRYANPDSVFSFRNCTLAVADDTIQGMAMTFAIPPADPTTAASSQVEPQSESRSESKGADTTAEPDVLAPYALEQPNSWYLCALGVFPEFRCQILNR